MSSGSGAVRWEGCEDQAEGSGLDQMGPGAQGARVEITLGGQAEGCLGMLRGGLSHTIHYRALVFSVHGALEVVDDALERQSPEALLAALQDPALALQGVRRDFADWYLEQLSSDREQKAEVRLCQCHATSCCLQDGERPLT